MVDFRCGKTLVGRFVPQSLRAVLLASVLGTLAVLASTTPAVALVINPTFDASINAQSNAAAIKAAFNKAAGFYQNAFNDPVTVNIAVSWGTVHGSTIYSGNLGQSWVPWYQYYTLGAVKTYLTRDATSTNDTIAINSIPVSPPTGTGRFVIPFAQAKALKLISGTATATDGYIGFGKTPSSYTFDDTAGVAAGTYDFVSVAEHEIAEVLGRLSTLNGNSAPTSASIFDLFRYTGVGSPSFAYNAPAYFSVNGGVTGLANFNNSSSGGDRSDWLSSSLSTDSQAAFLYPGKVLSVSPADYAVLDILGWTATNTTLTVIAGAKAVGGIKSAGIGAIPEPTGIAVLGVALLGLSLARRRN